MKRSTAVRELRALVGTYLEGSDDSARAAELLDVIDTAPGTAHAAAAAAAAAVTAQDNREHAMYGCTKVEATIDQALKGRDPRDIVMYAMSVLSDAQELIRGFPVSDRNADTARILMNMAKYAIDKAVPR